MNDVNAEGRCRDLLNLKKAGIPYKDEAGLYADFHALRNTICSMLLSAGTNIKVVQTLMRPSTITLAMNVYGHVWHTTWRVGLRVCRKWEAGREGCRPQALLNSSVF